MMVIVVTLQPVTQLHSSDFCGNIRKTWQSISQEKVILDREWQMRSVADGDSI